MNLAMIFGVFNTFLSAKFIILYSKFCVGFDFFNFFYSDHYNIEIKSQLKHSAFPLILELSLYFILHWFTSLYSYRQIICLIFLYITLQ